MKKLTVWTEKDVKDLRRLVVARKGRCIDWEAIHARFPDRTKAAVYKKLYQHRMTLPMLWTRAEDDILRKSWNEVGNRSLVRRLKGRTFCAIYERARHLGLRAGTPQGMVSVKALSNDPRWGYDYYKTLKILRTHGVSLHRYSYASLKTSARGTLYVEEADAREAAEAWERAIAAQRVGKESPKEAARRLGVRSHIMAQWLTDEGLLGPRREGVKRRFWAEPKVYDEVVAKYRKRPKERPTGQECPKDAAKRLGVSYDTLRRWLTIDGIMPTQPKETKRMRFAPSEVYDEVFRRRRQPPDAGVSDLAITSTKIDGTAPPATITPPAA